MGLTNNEVKFLVTLDIDEDKSKKKIDGFLEKTLKEQKITFDVAIGKSEHNINEFLKKHKEKKASILFDVSVGKSNSNISTYLSNRKQDTQSLIFYVNEGATKSKINNALSTMQFNPALIEIGVKSTESLANINRFIDNSKTHKKLIELDIDDTNGFSVVNGKIDKKQLNKARLSLTLAQGAFDGITESLKDKVFTGAKLVGELDVEATHQKISRQIKKMKLPTFVIDVEPTITKIVEPKVKPKPTSQPSTPPTPSTEKPYDSFTKGFKGIKKEYKELGQTVALFNKTRAEAESQFISDLKRSGKQVEIIRDAQTQQITKVTTTFKNSANEVQKDVFVPLVRNFQSLDKAGKTTEHQLNGFIAEVNKLKNTEKFNLTKEVEKFRAKLEEARHTATATASVLNSFARKASQATSRNEIDKLTNDLEKHQAEMRKRNQLEKEQINLISQQKQLYSNLTRIQQMYLRTVKKEEADAIRDSINAIGQLKALTSSGKGLYKLDMGDMREAKEQIIAVNSQIKTLNANATEASKNSMGIIASLKTAMEKFPIWMIASTAFYGTIATFREFGSVILDIDKKMTDLKKVMADGTDFGAIFENATVSAETFGKTISETLDAYNMFAKQGFKGEELQTLSNAGLVAGNVGDIDAGKASEYLTASILQWNKKTSEAMGIVDSWNEISNNFATTVENLAQGQAKAGATARALGMDFDQLNAVVGTLNARTKQSGNEIGNFVKSTFANILSNKGRDVLESLNVELENADGTMRDLMDVYTEVAIKYKELSQAGKNEVTLGLAGKYHISRMQTLLDDLGSANSMYKEMYKTSQNSANSAMEENQKYMQSLEARMNLARVEVEKLALAIGEAFMTEGMIQALQAFRALAEGVTAVVKEVGFLPIAFLGIITVLGTLSNRFGDVIDKVTQFVGSSGRIKSALSSQSDETRELNQQLKENANATTNSSKNTTQLTTVHTGNTKETDKNTDSTNRNTEAKKKASKASKVLSLGFGALGVASVALGFAIEGLLGWISKARQEEEEFNNKLTEQIATFEANEETIKSLSTRYSELSESEKALDPNTKEYAELTEIQNELARLLPEVKKGEDGLGNSIIQSSGYIEQKVAMMEKQLELQKSINEEEAKAKEQENTENARDGIEDSQKEIDKLLKETGGNIYKFKNAKNYSTKDGEVFNLKEALGLDDWAQDLKDAEQLSKAIAEIRGALAKKDEYGFSEGYTQEMEFALDNLVEKYQNIEKANLSIIQNTDTLRTKYATQIDGIIGKAKDFEDESLEVFKNVASGALGIAESEDAFEGLSDALEDVTKASKDGETNEFAKSFNTLSETISTMKENSTSDLEEFEKTFRTKLDKIKAKILELSGLKIGSPEYKALEKSLNNVINKSYNYEVQLRSTSKETGKSIEEVREFYAIHGEGADIIETETKTLAEYTSGIRTLESAMEKSIGVSEKLISETEDLVSVYEHLSDVTNLTEEEQGYLTDAMEKLKALYPHLTKYGEIRIEAVKEENRINNILKDSYENVTNGHYNSEQKRTYYTALEANRRIEIIKKEMEAMYKAQSIAYSEYEKLMAKHESGEALTESEQRGLMQMSQSRGDYIGYGEYAEKQREIEDIQNSLSSTASTLDNFNSIIDKNTSSSKKNSKEVSELDKVTSKYATTLEKLETQMAEVQAKQRKYPTYSKQYRNALQEEINLLNKQIDLNNQKSKDLNGVPVTSTSNSTSENGGSIGTLSGWNNKITSSYKGKEGFRDNPHTGIDIDGYMGERLDANVSGRVVDKGKNSISGNYISIMDKDGYKHFYGHLKDIAVNIDQLVNIGDKLGSIGNTGNVYSKTGDGSHLHYQVSKDGKEVDPTNFAKSAKGEVTINVNTVNSPASTGNSTKDAIWNFFKGKGLSDNAVSGIMGNIQQESNFNPNSVNKSSGASGIFQWLGSRKTDLQNFAKEQGKTWDNLQTQLEFAWKELQSTEKKSLSSLQKDMSVSDHASEFNRLFERSGEKAGSKGHNNRLSFAQSAYNTYNGKGSTASSGGATVGSDDHEKALQTIEQLKRENIQLAEQAQLKYYEIIKSSQAEMQRNVQAETNSQQRQEAIKASHKQTSKQYENATNSQYSSEKKKIALYQQEHKYIQQRLDAGNLLQIQIDELTDRRLELNGLIIEAQNAEKEYYGQVVGVYLARYDESMNKFAETLAWEEVKIRSVDKASSRYNATLEIMARARANQVEAIKEESKYIEKQLKSGKLSAQMYQEMTARANDLKRELIETTMALQDLNYEMIMTNVALSDERIDDIDFKIESSKGYSGLYEDGSADQKRELEYQLELMEEKLAELEKRGETIQIDMNGKNLGHEALQELEEQLEDNKLAVLDMKGAIKDTKKELEDFDKILDEKIKDEREKVVDKILDTLKDSYEELRDIENERYDDLIEKEQKRHDKVMKNYDDELDAYNDIIDAMRREIEDEDRDRTHNNNIQDLTKEKADLQSKLNLLSNVNTYEGKKEKEELQKQIAEIEKQIAEENYQYEKDLRNQQLDDLLEDKTDSIEDLKEKEQENTENVLDELEKKQEYWDKYYSDLINDEAKFEQLREDMMAGHFDEIEALFAEHTEKLKESLPDLELSIEGMTERVGTQIRENVINEMQNLLEEIKKVEEEVRRIENLKNNVTGDSGSSFDKPPSNNLNDENGNMKEADLKVILAKFMNEQIAGKLDPVKDKARIQNIKDKSYALAQEGRSEGSTIGADQSLSSIFNSMNGSQVKQIGDYFKNNASQSGFSTKDYIDFIENFGGETAGQGKLLSRGDKQVLFAKYMREKLVPIAPDQKTKDALKATSNKIAESGRNNLSLISSGVGYDSQVDKLSRQQLYELGDWFLSNSGVVANGSLRSKLEEDGERLKLSNDNQYVGLSTGGMTKAFGSTGGVDGKGGKMALLHEREIVLNPIDTERMFKISSIMDSIMRTINGAINLPTLPKFNLGNGSGNASNSEHTTININIAKLNGTQSDIDNLAKQIQNRLLREKGKR